MRILLIGMLLLLAACSSDENQSATQQQSAPVVKSAEKAAQQVDEAAQAIKQTAETAAEQAQTKASEQVAAAVESGQLVYSANCKSCHGSGVMGAPKLGDPSLQGDLDKLVQNAINGIGRMPARGGVASLSDAKVRAAVGYMVEQSR